MNEPFNLNQPYTIAIKQQWLPPGAANCMVFNFDTNTVQSKLHENAAYIYQLI